MGSLLNVKADFSGVLGMIERLTEKLETGFTEELEEWGEGMLDLWAERWGEDMTPLSPVTLIVKRQMGYPDTPLVREGDLFAAAVHRGAPGNIFAVSGGGGSLGEIKLGVSEAIPYAEVQHDGGIADLSVIPPRPWDAIGEEELSMLGVRIADSVRGAMEAG